jgi:hypothetical protein
MVEIHKPPNVKVIDEIWVGMSEDENGKNGRQRLTVERERHRVLAMSNVRTSRSEPTISSIGSPVNPMRLGERGHKMILTAAVATRPGVAAAAVR